MDEKIKQLVNQVKTIW